MFPLFSINQVCTVKAHELASHIPISSLPEHLGGTSHYSHVAWIQSCVNIQTNSVQGDTQEHDAHDCVGSLLRSYSLDNSNTSIGATLSHTHMNTQLVTEQAVANSNCYDDNNANPHNHCGLVEGRTRGLGQYQQSSNAAADRSQRNHHHWNGSAVSRANTSAIGPNANINGRGCQPPPQSDTPPNTPHSQNDDGSDANGKPTDSASRSQNEDVKEEEEEEGEEEEGVPPLPQKSLPRPPNQPSSQSPPLSSSWDTDDENRCMELSVHMPEQGGMRVKELVDYVKIKKKKGIYQEYEDIRKEPPAGTFDYSK